MLVNRLPLVHTTQTTARFGHVAGRLWASPRLAHTHALERAVAVAGLITATQKNENGARACSRLSAFEIVLAHHIDMTTPTNV